MQASFQRRRKCYQDLLGKLGEGIHRNGHPG